MAEFDIKINNLKSKKSEYDEIIKNLSQARDTVIRARTGITLSGKNGERVMRRLEGIADKLIDQKDHTKSLSGGLVDVLETYGKHEDILLKSCKDGKITYSDEKRQNPYDFEWVVGKGKWKNDIKKRPDKWSKKGYFDKDGWHEEIDDDDDKKKKSKFKFKDVQVFGATASAEAMVWGIKDDEGAVTYTVKALDAEWHANAGLGTLSYEDKDGKRHTGFGAVGTLGASATAFTAEGKAMLGDEMLGAYVSGDVTVGRAAASVDSKIGMIDGQLYASIKGEAELIGAEANAKVGANVLGADVSGEIGVSVGIGGHLDVGVEGGKIKLDIGAAVGVGVSANLEIDLSGTLKVAGDIAKGAGDIAKGVGDAVGKVADGIGKGIGAIGKAICWW